MKQPNFQKIKVKSSRDHQFRRITSNFGFLRRFPFPQFFLSFKLVALVKHFSISYFLSTSNTASIKYCCVFAEVRELGVGYFAFSGKQAEREEQMKRLEQYRQETEKRKQEAETKKKKQQVS